MKKLFVITALMMATFIGFAQNIPADKIVGIWVGDNSDVQLKFEIFKLNDKYFGKLLWASTMFEADGKTSKKDFKNPNKKLRNRSRLNMVNMTHLKYDDGEYEDGKLYNPDDGRTYNLNAKMKNENEMEFRGYIGVSLLGKTMKFKRVSTK